MPDASARVGLPRRTLRGGRRQSRHVAQRGSAPGAGCSLIAGLGADEQLARTSAHRGFDDAMHLHPQGDAGGRAFPDQLPRSLAEQLTDVGSGFQRHAVHLRQLGRDSREELPCPIKMQRDGRRSRRPRPPSGSPPRGLRRRRDRALRLRNIVVCRRRFAVIRRAEGRNQRP